MIRHKTNSKLTLSEDHYEDLVWKACHGCPHNWTEWHDQSPCILRGFIYWLYEHEPPSDEIIKQMEFPASWKCIRGEKPLALAMAVQLYSIAWSAGLQRLSLEMFQFVFDHFKKSRSVPQTILLRSLYALGESIDHLPLQKFFVDIYYKWCDEESLGLEDDYPPGFLFDILKLRAKRNKLFAGEGKEENLVLRLSDYHCDGSNEFCPTRNGDTGDTWVIR